MRCLSWVLVIEGGGCFLKPFIINQRNPLRETPFFFLFEMHWLIVIAHSAWRSINVCFVTWYSGPTGFLSSSRPPCSVSPALYHSNRLRWEGSKTGTDNIFFHAVENKTLGVYFTGGLFSWETREKRRKCFTAQIW